MNETYEHYKKEVDRLSAELSAKYYAAQDALTRDQLADAIGQAILSGDFIRHVAPGERQQVVYVPGAEADRLREALRRCQEEYESEPCCSCGNEMCEM